MTDLAFVTRTYFADDWASTNSNGEVLLVSAIDTIHFPFIIDPHCFTVGVQSFDIAYMDDNFIEGGPFLKIGYGLLVPPQIGTDPKTLEVRPYLCGLDKVSGGNLINHRSARLTLGIFVQRATS
jgi:hypothetical protein